jgi:NADH-quinone oxidoreductase subunit E
MIKTSLTSASGIFLDFAALGLAPRMLWQAGHGGLLTVSITAQPRGKNEAYAMVAQKRTTLRRYIYQGDPLLAPPPPELAAILERYRGQPDALITVLEEIQDHYGYLPPQGLQYTAHELGFPLSRVYGVATFYNLFQLHPPGRYLVRICKGTACHVNRAATILARVQEQLRIGEDETTPNGLFTLQTVSCMGACSLAPVLVVNDHTYGRMTPEKAVATLAALQAEATGKEGQ